MIYYLVVIDEEHYAAQPYDVRTRVQKVEACEFCGALVVATDGFQHEEWHRQNDIQVIESELH